MADLVMQLVVELLAGLLADLALGLRRGADVIRTMAVLLLIKG